MAGEYGPYVQPGWPEGLPKMPTPGATFLNAFAVTSDVNRRKQQLENQLQIAALKTQEADLRRQQQEGDFNRRQDLLEQRLYMEQKVKEVSDRFKEAEIHKIYEGLEFKEKEVTDTQGFDTYMRNAGDAGKPGNAAYPATWRAAHILNPQARVKDKEMEDEQNKQLRLQRAGVDSEEKKFWEGLKPKYFHGQLIDDATIFTEPNRTLKGFKTKPTPEEEAQGIHEGPVLPNIDPKTGKLVKKALDERAQLRDFVFGPKGYEDADTRIVLLPPAVSGTNIPNYGRIPVKEWMDRNKEYQDIQARRHQIPSDEATTNTAAAPIRAYTPEDVKKIPKGQGITFLYPDPKTGQLTLYVKP